jgi:hypothetical protein
VTTRIQHLASIDATCAASLDRDDCDPGKAFGRRSLDEGAYPEYRTAFEQEFVRASSAARSASRPSAPPRVITLAEAQSYAERILADSYTAIPRDQLEELAQCVLLIEAAPHDEIAMLRQALTATYQRLDDARRELAAVRTNTPAPATPQLPDVLSASALW